VAWEDRYQWWVGRLMIWIEVVVACYKAVPGFLLALLSKSTKTSVWNLCWKNSCLNWGISWWSVWKLCETASHNICILHPFQFVINNHDASYPYAALWNQCSSLLTERLYRAHYVFNSLADTLVQKSDIRHDPKVTGSLPTSQPVEFLQTFNSSI
jgi:hypothetical protein